MRPLKRQAQGFECAGLSQQSPGHALPVKVAGEGSAPNSEDAPGPPVMAAMPGGDQGQGDLLVPQLPHTSLPHLLELFPQGTWDSRAAWERAVRPLILCTYVPIVISGLCAGRCYQNGWSKE